MRSKVTKEVAFGFIFLAFGTLVESPKTGGPMKNSTPVGVETFLLPIWVLGSFTR